MASPPHDDRLCGVLMMYNGLLSYGEAEQNDDWKVQRILLAFENGDYHSLSDLRNMIGEMAKSDSKGVSLTQVRTGLKRLWHHEKTQEILFEMQQSPDTSDAQEAAAGELWKLVKT
jgi:hypothetical protein